MVRVPLEDLEIGRKAAEDGVAPGRRGEEDLAGPELRFGAPLAARANTEAGKLRVEADAEVREPVKYRFPDRPLLVHEPRILLLLPDADAAPMTTTRP